MSDDDLTWAVQASVAQIALMWTVHQWEADEPNKPLDVQIINFSSHALSEMCAAYPILQNATEELRWLTYFKGLIAADNAPARSNVKRYGYGETAGNTEIERIEKVRIG